MIEDQMAPMEYTSDEGEGDLKDPRLAPSTERKHTFE
jgi:hypothetical protein